MMHDGRDSREAYARLWDRNNPRPHSFALTEPSSIRSFISDLGQSGFSDGSGRSRSQAHFPANSGDNDPSSICTIYFPSTGKNFHPWNEPHVATYSPFAAECGEIMKSELVVKASLLKELVTDHN